MRAVKKRKQLKLLNFQPRRFEIPESKFTTHLHSLDTVILVKREKTKRFSVVCGERLQIMKMVLKVAIHKHIIPNNLKTSFQYIK